MSPSPFGDREPDDRRLRDMRLRMKLREPVGIFPGTLECNDVRPVILARLRPWSKRTYSGSSHDVLPLTRRFSSQADSVLTLANTAPGTHNVSQLHRLVENF
jgi:hypothetical protein